MMMRYHLLVLSFTVRESLTPPQPDSLSRALPVAPFCAFSSATVKYGDTTVRETIVTETHLTWANRAATCTGVSAGTTRLWVSAIGGVEPDAVPTATTALSLVVR